MRRSLRRRLFVLVPLLLLGAAGWTAYRNGRQARLDYELVIAIEDADLPRANALLDSGADPDARPVLRASSAWQRLLDSLVGRRRAVGHPVLAAAASSYQWEAAQALARRGANPDVRDQYGRTPLMHAAYSGQLALVRVLLQQGADMRATDSEGRAALAYAARAPDIDEGMAVATLLLSRGGPTFGREGSWQRPPRRVTRTLPGCSCGRAPTRTGGGRRGTQRCP